MKSRLILCLLAPMCLLSSCGGQSMSSTSSETAQLDYLEKDDIKNYLTLSGRYWVDDGNGYCFYNTGSEVMIKFVGTYLEVELQSIAVTTGWNKSEITVAIDGEKDLEKNIQTIGKFESITKKKIVENLENKEHIVRIIKRHGSNKDLIKFFSFKTDGYFVKYQHDYSLKIEIYGDSISCGANALRPNQMEAVNSPEYESYTATYESVCAEAINAQVSVFGRDGSPIHYASLSEKTAWDINYEQCSIDDTEHKYDFSYIPDVVILHSGGNDGRLSNVYSLGYNSKDMQKYIVEFIKKAVYEKYGKQIPVILMSGVMGNQYDLVNIMGQVKKQMNEERYDVSHYIFDAAVFDHPIASEHKAIGEKLAEYLKAKFDLN